MSIREIENGIRARDEYESLADRFSVIRKNIHDAWENTTAMQTDIREALYHKAHVLRELERSFLNDIKTGELAEKQQVAENARTK